MALTLLSTTTALYDLTFNSEVLLVTVDGSNPRYAKVIIVIGDVGNPLDGSGGDFIFDLYIDDVLHDGNSQIKTLGGVTEAVFISNELIIPTGVPLRIEVASPNAGDTNVRVVAAVYDIPTGNMIEIAGSSEAAGNAAIVFDTDFGDNYSSANNRWDVNAAAIGDAAPNNISPAGATAACTASLKA